MDGALQVGVAQSMQVFDAMDPGSRASVRVAGLVDADDPNKPLSRFVLGIEITSDPNLTRIEDKTDANIDPLTIVDIVAGNYVEARGQEFPAGTGILAATLLERDDGTIADTELRGFVEVGGKNEPNLTVLSVTIRTNGATVYRDDRLGTNLLMDPADFWLEVAEGSPVEAKGIEEADRAMLAEELELED